MTPKIFNLKNLLEFSFLNVFLFPIYPSNFRPSLIVILLLTTLIYAFRNNQIPKLKKQNKLVYVNSCLFIVLCFSLFYSENLKIGISTTFRILPLVLLPLVFNYIYKLKLFSDTLILRSYASFYIATALLFISFFVYFYFKGNVTVHFLLHYVERINTQLGRYCLHPIYASMYISIALIISTQLLKKNVLNRRLIIVLNILLVLNLILLARKSALIIMLVFFLFYQLKISKKKTVHKTSAIILMTLVVLLILSFIPDISYRFTDVFEGIDSFKVNKSISLRLNIMQCGYAAILEHPYFGFGIGDVKLRLNDCYATLPEVFGNRYFNSHNQYMGVWLAAGILGVISLLTMILYNFFIAIKNRDIVFGAVIVLFFCIMFIESILERQDGVLLFALFINMLSFKNLKENCTLKK